MASAKRLRPSDARGPPAFVIFCIQSAGPRRSRYNLFVFLIILTACSTPDVVDTAEPVDCEAAPAVSWSGWGQGFFLTYCDACHSQTSPNRNGAPEGVDFDTEAQVRAQADRIRQRVLVEGTMPLGSGVYEEDLSYLDVLLSCSL